MCIHQPQTGEIVEFERCHVTSLSFVRLIHYTIDIIIILISVWDRKDFETKRGSAQTHSDDDDDDGLS